MITEVKEGDVIIRVTWESTGDPFDPVEIIETEVIKYDASFCLNVLRTHEDSQI